MFLDFFLKKKKEFLFNFNIKSDSIHFIGIGGCGMFSIAEYLFKNGFIVTGSDLYFNDKIKYLINLGIKININHSYKNVLNCKIIVVSSAIDNNNPEIIYAKLKKIPILKRMDILFEIFKNKYIISVIGSHGKTTTTAMIFDNLFNCGIKINCINGGNIKSISSHSFFYESNYLLIEVDESNNSFLCLRPTIIVLTNIDNDHIINYNNKINNLICSIIKFLHFVPFYGYIILCIDNIFIKRILMRENFKCKIITYGFDFNSNYRILNYYQKYNKIFYSLLIFNKKIIKFKLPLIGKHNILNSVASFIVCCLFKNVKVNILVKSLKNFKGVSRRSEIVGCFSFYFRKKKYKNILIIYDYGHHPTEIYNNIISIKKINLNRRIIMIFQPHRYSRTKICFYDFIYVLSKVDILFLLDIYHAYEKNIFNISSNNILCSLYNIGKFNSILVKDYIILKYYLINIINNDDIIVFQGAGNLDFIINNFISILKKNK